LENSISVASACSVRVGMVTLRAPTEKEIHIERRTLKIKIFLGYQNTHTPAHVQSISIDSSRED